MEREYRTPHSPVGNTRKSNVMFKRPKMAHYDVYTYQGMLRRGGGGGGGGQGGDCPPPPQYKHECGFMKQMF